MTAPELLAIARKSRPNVRYTTNRKHNAIAAWCDGRWVTVASLTLLGTWVESRFELLVDGLPLYPQADWLDGAESVS